MRVDDRNANGSSQPARTPHSVCISESARRAECPEHLIIQIRFLGDHMRLSILFGGFQSRFNHGSIVRWGFWALGFVICCVSLLDICLLLSVVVLFLFSFYFHDAHGSIMFPIMNVIKSPEKDVGVYVRSERRPWYEIWPELHCLWQEGVEAGLWRFCAFFILELARIEIELYLLLSICTLFCSWSFVARVNLYSAFEFFSVFYLCWELGYGSSGICGYGLYCSIWAPEIV